MAILFFLKLLTFFLMLQQSGSDLADLEANSRRLSHSLYIMHQLGLTDDAINIQALQVRVSYAYYAYFMFE